MFSREIILRFLHSLGLTVVFTAFAIVVATVIVITIFLVFPPV